MVFRDIVIKGRGLGKGTGYPTANLRGSHNIPSGVYRAVIFFKNRHYDGFLIVGAFHQSDGLPIEEVYLLNFNEDLYGKKLKIEVGEKMRAIRKFKSVTGLKRQIKRDIEKLCLPVSSKNKPKLSRGK